MKNQTESVTTAVVVVCILAIVLFVPSCMYIMPQYGVYKQGLIGQASLARAEQTKLIMIEQARAEVQSASLRAEAIQIVGQAAKDFPEYRLQEFMGAFAEALQEGNIDQIIYVPTEANIPIMEATRLR